MVDGSEWVRNDGGERRGAVRGRSGDRIPYGMPDYTQCQCDSKLAASIALTIAYLQLCLLTQLLRFIDEITLGRRYKLRR